MTIPQPAAPAASPPVPVPPPPPKYTPPAGSRNESLLDMLETAKAQVKEAEKRVRAIKAAIENEATVMFAGARVIDIPAGPNRPPYRLRWVTPQKVSHDILKERYLGVYNECLVWSTPYWQLEKVKG